MTSEHTSDQTPQPAEVSKARPISLIWIVPFIALLIGGWMLYYQWANKGPIIEIAFATAEGMQAGKTKIKYRNVDLGEIKSIVLNDKSSGIIVTAQMSNKAEHLLAEDSNFWIVSPKISYSGVSGLSTLISGVYIEMSPGQSKNSADDFIALADPPITPTGTPGLRITFNSNDQFAYSKGDPIIYKGLSVGQFEDINFDFKERIVYYDAFIKAPYHQLVTSNTKFWDASGLTVNMDANGVSVKTGNIETLLTNGVTFDVPTGMQYGETVKNGEKFDIYKNYEAADNQRYKHSVNFVVLVSDTIRGLKVGAPVEYRGVLVGHVAATNLLLEQKLPSSEILEENFKIPVLISLQPGRVNLPDSAEGLLMMRQQNFYWIRQGLKATLKTGNLITGSLFVELRHHNDKPIKKLQQFSGYTVIPSIRDDFAQITAKANQFISTLNKLPLEKLVNNGDSLLVESVQTLKEIKYLSRNAKKLVNNIKNDKVSKKLADTLDNVAQLSTDYSEGSKGYEELLRTLTSLTTVMYELKPLLNQVNRQPNSLIFNSGKGVTIEPKRHKGASQ